MYVEVFKTNVQHVKEARKLLAVLQAHFPDCSFNFDLEDCNKILRAQGKRVVQDTSNLIQIVAATGHQIEVLPG